MVLSKIRKKISKIDEQIILLLAQRFQLIPDLIKEKKKLGLKSFQPMREQELQMMYYALSMKHGLNPTLVQSLFAQIVKESRTLQEKTL